MNRKIKAQDASVLRALDGAEDIRTIAKQCGLTLPELRESMRRLALREPAPNDMRLVTP